MFCNLSEDSVELLARALEKNTKIGAFTCRENPFNFPNGRDYDPESDAMLRQAIINTKAPITKWNWKPLPPDMVAGRKLNLLPLDEVKARRLRVAAAPAVVRVAAVSPVSTAIAEKRSGLEDILHAFIGLNIDACEAESYALKLKNEGFDSLKDLVELKESDLDKLGITKILHRRKILTLIASLPPMAFASVASLPPLPGPLKFYGFTSHDWGKGDSNHKRVWRIVDTFAQQGKPLWFDEIIKEQLESEITNGMDVCATFIVFVTAAYVQKVQEASDKDSTDWCFFEFNYAGTTKLRKTVVVVMEPEMKDQSKWNGPVGGRLANALWIDYTSEDKFESCCNQLAAAIAGKI